MPLKFKYASAIMSVEPHLGHFVSVETSSVKQLHDDPDVFALGLQIFSAGVPDETLWEFVIGPWQYVSSSPPRNPGKFDLWIEVKTKKRSVTIGNWKEAELVHPCRDTRCSGVRRSAGSHIRPGYRG